MGKRTRRVRLEDRVLPGHDTAMLEMLVKGLYEYNGLARRIKQNNGSPRVDRLNKLADIIEDSLDSLAPRLNLEIKRVQDASLQSDEDIRYEKELLMLAGFHSKEAGNMLQRAVHGYSHGIRIEDAAAIKEQFRRHHQALQAYAETLRMRHVPSMSLRPFKVDTYRLGMFGICALIVNLVDSGRYDVSYSLGCGALGLSLGRPLRIEPKVHAAFSSRCIRA